MILGAKAFAKINLSLDVVEKSDNGYHLIQSIIQSVSLCDYIKIKKQADFKCVCSDRTIPENDENLAVKAAKAFFEKVGVDGGVYIEIKKNIPSQAGLGGGSADAATVLRLLNNACGSNLSDGDLAAIGARIGADVPAAVYGGVVFCEGFGEKVTPLPDFMDCPIVISSPNTGVSTKSAYQLIDKISLKHSSDYPFLISKLKENNLKEFFKNCYNSFEEVIRLKEIETTKNIISRYNPLSCHMTGTGSSVFAIFENTADAKQCFNKLKKINPKTFLTKPV